MHSLTHATQDEGQCIPFQGRATAIFMADTSTNQLHLDYTIHVCTVAIKTDSIIHACICNLQYTSLHIYTYTSTSIVLKTTDSWLRCTRDLYLLEITTQALYGYSHTSVA